MDHEIPTDDVNGPSSSPSPSAWWSAPPVAVTETAAPVDDATEPLPQPVPNWSSSWAVTPPAPPASAAVESEPRERASHRPFRTALAAGLIGAVIGGGISGAIVAGVTNNDDTSSTTRSSSILPARESTQLAKPGDIRSILDKVQPAVVRIDSNITGTFGNTEQGTGTGFIIDSSGIIVTNNHVVANATSLNVTLNDGDRLKGRVLGTAPTFDLAVVQVDRTGLPTVPLGDSDQVQVGDAVVAIGNALALEGGTGPTVTTGIVSGLGREVQISGTEDLRNMVQTDAAINPGNSGGPLVDVNGRVIGINTAIASPQDSNNVGFAIAISSAKPIIEDLRAGKKAQAAFLGVETQPLTPSAAAERHLGNATGALVLRVTPSSPAGRAGVKRDDVIVEIDGSKVQRSTDVFAAVRRHRPGDTINIVILRGTVRSTLHVTLASTTQ
jgi:S1-C subfamily serine protease